MYRGFDLNLKGIERKNSYPDCRASGEHEHILNMQTVRPLLSQFMQKDKTLDGDGIQKAWFPQIKADVFISHSHKDLDSAFFLAGWLKERLNLTSFIDACFWGHSDDLQMEIDKDNCETGPNLYSYELRNHSTAHVHMMLATALNMMMDRTECIFFVNSPNSIQPYGKIDKTDSPWLYAEISATHFLRVNIPSRRKIFVESSKTLSKLESFEKGGKIMHPVDLSHLDKLNFDDLLVWKKNTIQRGPSSLDLLYHLHPPKNK